MHQETNRTAHTTDAEAAPCPVWPTLCADTTPSHYDHVSADCSEQMLSVTFLQFSDSEGVTPPKISITGMGSEDYTPAEVRAKTAELRRLLDIADQMADQATAGDAQPVPVPDQQTFSAARTAIDAAFTMSSNLQQTRDALHVVVDMTADEVASPIGDAGPLAAEPTDFQVAIHVAQQLLDSDQVLSLREALRLLLRALDAEPDAAAKRLADLHAACRADYNTARSHRTGEPL